MLSCWHDLLFFLSPTVLSFLPSMGRLCGVGVFELIECPHSLPALHSRLQNNNYYYYIYAYIFIFYIIKICLKKSFKFK